jgi:hypothetical protein
MTWILIELGVINEVVVLAGLVKWEIRVCHDVLVLRLLLIVQSLLKEVLMSLLWLIQEIVLVFLLRRWLLLLPLLSLLFLRILCHCSWRCSHLLLNRCFRSSCLQCLVIILLLVCLLLHEFLEEFWILDLVEVGASIATSYWQLLTLCWFLFFLLL